MLTINTMGVFELLDSAGMPIHGVMSRDKRVALLIYLLLAKPRSAHRRDALLALFWPEQDAPRARNSLRQSLHLLRRTLGDHVIIASNAAVEVNRNLLTCDVLEFEALLDAGRPREALNLFRGPFMPGFYIAGAAQYNDWMETERDRLRQRALDTVLELAQAASDDHPRAIHWLKYAEQLAPFQEDVVRELMRHHLISNNPGLALCAYERLVGRMTRELEVDVSPQTKSLAADIPRSGVLR